MNTKKDTVSLKLNPLFYGSQSNSNQINTQNPKK